MFSPAHKLNLLEIFFNIIDYVNVVFKVIESPKLY